MYSFINYLRLFACLLITNFHFDLLYPERLRILAFGGDLGNNLFFLISGFCLYSSVQQRRFGQWLKIRYCKILPTVLFMELLSVVLFQMKIDSLMSLLQMFLFPTLFWFTGAIILFYPLFYLFARGMNQKGYLIYLAVFGGTVLHLAFDGIFVERYVIGFLAMLAGACLYEKLVQNPFCVSSRKIYRVSGGCSALVLVLYIFLKLLRMKTTKNPVLIHYGIGLASVVFAALLLITFFYLEQYRKDRERGRSQKKTGRLVSFAAASTLQIYLVQSLGERFLIRLFEKVIFPVNYILSFCLILLAAAVLKSLGDKLGTVLFRPERKAV